VYAFIEVHANCYPVIVQCQILKVSRSAYYSWKEKKCAGGDADEKKKEMEQTVISIFKEHLRRYGVRRVTAELKARATKVSAYKVRKVMGKNGLKAIQPRSFVPKTTDSRHPYAISRNLLAERSFPIKPNEVWVSDITYIALASGSFLYLAVWMDLFSRKIIGWQLKDHMKEALIIEAFQKALQNRVAPKGLIVHSDRGGQYAGSTFRQLIASKDILQSMSRADNPYDNAFMESCFSRFKAELMQDGAFDNAEDAQTEIFEYIEMYYNTKRRHSSLNYQSPMNFESNYYFYKT